MLNDCLFESRSSARSRKPVMLVISAFVHGGLVVGLILIPLFQTQLLPQVSLFEPLPAPLGAAVRTVQLAPISGGPPAGRHHSVPAETSALMEPMKIPSTIAVVEDGPRSSVIGAGLTGAGVASFGPSFGGSPFGDPNGLGLGLSAPLPPPRPSAAERLPTTPSPPPEPVPAGPIRIGGGLVQSNLIESVMPVYPRLARASRTQGTVTLEALITREGKISDLRVTSGHVLLQEAAIEAVKQWRYRPTLLNGEPVEVITTITINFTLN